jgi:glutathione S-transferase
MKLYVIPGACSLAPHIALRELNLPFELIMVDRATKRTSDGEDFLMINPLGYVGSLKLDDENVLTETSTILEYLADLKPESGLAPLAQTWERVRFREWLSFLSCELNSSMSPLFRDIPQEAKDVITSRLLRRFDLLNDRLNHQNYVVGNTYSLADAYLFTVLLWPRRVGIDMTPWPNLLRYHTSIGTREAVKASMDAEGI